MSTFTLKSDFKPAGDQPKAIEALTNGVNKNHHDQVLLGVTGSGKTFTLANIIQNTQLPALVISHNKTLAGQLYQEFRDFFPQNAVSYFVSYYDYYQPEAYVPTTDTYIEKEVDINEEIDKLRLAATTNILTRKDVIVVASVSCIYNLGSPREYGKFVLELATGVNVNKEQVVDRLIDLQYEHSGFDFKRGTFRERDNAIDIYLAYADKALRIVFENQCVNSLTLFNPVSGIDGNEVQHDTFIVFPAKHYMTDTTNQPVLNQIRLDLKKQIKHFNKLNKPLEAYRIEKRVKYDLEMMKEFGYVNGIENYSRYFDGRKKGEPPYTLLDYFIEKFGKKWLLIIDESHMTIPQLHGMYNGDKARKKILIDFGFRLPAALDNRPLSFAEFEKQMPQTLYVSATPSDWEKKKSKKIVEQIIRPTGLVDPDIEIYPSKNQMNRLKKQILKFKRQSKRILITTLTKRTSEDLAEYLSLQPELSDIKISYLHSDIHTLDRSDILDNLRRGQFDVLIGINLLREGLDLPEVALVVILDADKEGFLRSHTSLIQTMGRAARNEAGKVILYADIYTKSIRLAVEEVKRRRAIQLAYNKKNHIIPSSIQKPIRERLTPRIEASPDKPIIDSMTPVEKKKYIKELKKAMLQSAKELDFETAARLRDEITTLETT
jgi:excinuclease ABC subunit B